MYTQIHTCWLLQVIPSRFPWVSHPQLYITPYWCISLHPVSLWWCVFACDPATHKQFCPTHMNEREMAETSTENMWRRKENDSRRERTRNRESREGRVAGRAAAGHLFEHKYLCQRSQCRGTNYVESAQLGSSEERGGRREREQADKEISLLGR